MSGQVIRPQTSSSTDQRVRRSATPANFDYAIRYKKVTRMSVAFLEILEEFHDDLRDLIDSRPEHALQIDDLAAVVEVRDQLADAIMALSPLAGADRREPFSI